MTKMTPPSKVCTKCRQDKPVSDFYRNNSRPDGLTIWCKACHKAGARNRTQGKRIKGEIYRYVIREVKQVSDKEMIELEHQLNRIPIRQIVCSQCDQLFTCKLVYYRREDKYFCPDCIRDRVAKVLLERLNKFDPPEEGKCTKDI